MNNRKSNNVQRQTRSVNTTTKPSSVKATTSNEVEYSALDYLESIGVGISEVVKDATEQGLTTKDISKLTIDKEVFDDIMRSHLESVNNVEQIGNEVEGGGSEDEDSSVGNSSRPRVDKSIDKKEGDDFTITQCFEFTGTLNAFAEGRAKTSKTMLCSEMEAASHRPLIKESKISFIHNTTPFLINFNLEGARSTNVQMDDKDGTHKNVSYMIVPDVISPIRVDTPIFTHGHDTDFEIDNLQEKYAYATEHDIRASVQFPSIQEFIGDKMPSSKELDQYNKSKNAFVEAEQNFVLKDSPLGEFIEENVSGERVAMAWEDKFPNHIILPQREIESQIEDMKQMIESSPIGKMHGMTGSIARNDGQAWNHIPEGITDEEAKHLLNTRQSVLVMVEHSVQAYMKD